MKCDILWVIFIHFLNFWYQFVVIVTRYHSYIIVVTHTSTIIIIQDSNLSQKFMKHSDYIKDIYLQY